MRLIYAIVGLGLAAIAIFVLCVRIDGLQWELDCERHWNTRLTALHDAALAEITQLKTRLKCRK